MKIQFYLSLFYCILIFIASYYLSLIYYAGDQIHYTKVYDEIGSMSIVEAYAYYNIHLSSHEIVHFFIVWSLSSYINKNLLMSFFNGLFAFYAARIMFKLGGHPLIVILVLLLSYYPLVFYLAAERLKFGFLLFFISFWYLMNSKRSLAYLFGFLLVLAHIQIIISIASLLAIKFFDSLESLILRLKIEKTSLMLVFLGVIAFLVSFNQITGKMAVYLNGFDLIDFLKFVVIFLLSLFYSKYNGVYTKSRALLVVLLFFPLFLVTFLMGSDRTIFFGYFIFLYFALQVRGGLNVGVFATLIYGFYKSFIFIDNVLAHGHGFA